MEKSIFFGCHSFMNDPNCFEPKKGNESTADSISSRLHALVTKLAYLEVQHQFGDTDMSEVFSVVDELSDLREEYDNAVEKLQEQAEKLGLEIK